MRAVQPPVLGKRGLRIREISAVLDRAFDPFVHGGTKLDIGAGRFGCGLTLVARVASAHGGRAELRHSSSAGSELAISIPIARSA